MWTSPWAAQVSSKYGGCVPRTSLPWEPGERFRFSLRASLVSQLVKNPPAMQETSVGSLGWEDPLAKGMATHSNILAWGIPWTVSLGFTKSWTQLSDFLFRLRSHTAFFCHRHNSTQIQREGIPRPLPVNGRSVKDIFRRAHGMGFIWVQPFSENIICLTC